MPVRPISCLPLLLLIAAGVPSASAPLAVQTPKPPPPAKTNATARFAQSPWQVAFANGGKAVPLTPSPASIPDSVFRWAPPPGKRWTPTPDPQTIRFDHKSEDAACEEAATFYYFRAELDVPPGVDRASVRFHVRKAVDTYKLIVNGKGVPRAPLNASVTPLGRFLRPGRNAVTMVLANWCGEAVVEGARFTAASRRGTLTAVVWRHGLR